MRQHFLAAYRAALLAVLRAQFSGTKRFRGGLAGALQLARNPHVRGYLCGAGVTLCACCLPYGHDLLPCMHLLMASSATMSTCIAQMILLPCTCSQCTWPAAFLLRGCDSVQG